MEMYAYIAFVKYDRCMNPLICISWLQNIYWKWLLATIKINLLCFHKNAWSDKFFRRIHFRFQQPVMIFMKKVWKYTQNMFNSKEVVNASLQHHIHCTCMCNLSQIFNIITIFIVKSNNNIASVQKEKRIHVMILQTIFKVYRILKCNGKRQDWNLRTRDSNGFVTDNWVNVLRWFAVLWNNTSIQHEMILVIKCNQLESFLLTWIL